MVSLSINAATNRITTSGFAYDAAGNLVQWPGGTVTMGAEYDVDGRLSVVKWDGVERERYYCDARNLRVAGGGSYQVYGLSGELLGEYRPVPNSTVPEMWRERVYFAGRLVATLNNYGWEASNTDRLGSRPVARRYPFGEGGNADNDEFATYRKDTTAQHCYAWHRFYSATWGRFSSPDPYVMSGGLTNPQGWNRYSYVANDPVNFHDPEGLHRRAPGWTWRWVDVWTGEGWSGFWQELESWGTDQVDDPGPSGERGPVVPEPWMPVVSPLSNAKVRPELLARLDHFKNSHCDEVFSQVLPKYKFESFYSLALTINFYIVGSRSGQGPIDSRLTQHEVSGNGRPTTLANTLGGQNAVTITDGVLPAIILGEATANSGGLGNTLIHELLHAYTGYGDGRLFDLFKGHGLDQPNGNSTAEISRWISTDCRYTPGW